MPVLFKLQADEDLYNFIIVMDNAGMEISGNVTIIDQTNENHQRTFIMAAVIEVVSVILFAVTLYYGINHPSSKTLSQRPF